MLSCYRGLDIGSCRDSASTLWPVKGLREHGREVRGEGRGEEGEGRKEEGEGRKEGGEGRKGRGREKTFTSKYIVSSRFSLYFW